MEKFFNSFAEFITIPYKIIITLCVGALYLVLFILFLPLSLPYGIFQGIKFVIEKINDKNK